MKRSILFLFTAISLLLALSFAQAAPGLGPAISAQQTNAIHAIASLAAEAPDRIDSQLEAIGFPLRFMSKEWRAYPVVRKLEFASAAAEKAKLGGGKQMVALLAQRLKGKYDSVAYEPSLKPLLDVPVQQELLFQTTDLPPPAGLVLEPSKRKAIAAISKYSEGGALGGPQGILEYYFDLPTSTAYDILRTSRTPEEAITMGLAYVQERERDPSLRRLVARIDRVYSETARHETALDPYREKGGPEIQLAEMPKQAPHASGTSDLPHNEPPASNTPSAGGGAGGFPTRAGPGTPTEPIGPELPHVSPATAAERYSRFMETRYPIESGRGFSRMVEIRAGFGGVVLGNKVTSAVGLPKPTHLIWMPHTDENSGTTTGEIRIRFADGAERFYAPVDAEDAYAASLMLRGGQGFRPYVKDEGVGLVSLDPQDERPRFTDDNRIVWDGRWDITLHPALARLNLGRSVVMCDAIPISRKAFLDLVKARRGREAAARVGRLFSDDINNWKFTDAPLQVTTNGNRIIVQRAYNAQQPLSAEYRRQALLSMQGFEQEETNADDEFAGRFDDIARDVVLSSEHYKRLNDFAAVFALYRWAQAQGAVLVNTPSQPPLLDPAPASLILTDDRQFQLADYSTEASLLQEFYQESDGRFDRVAAHFPPALRSVAEQSASQRRSIQNQQVKLAELEQRLDDARLSFRALSLRLEEKISANQSSQRRQLLALEEAVEKEIRESSHNRTSGAATGGAAAARLTEFAATLDTALAKQLRSVLEDYQGVTAELQSAERTADDAQMHLNEQVQLALIGDGAADYEARYQKLKGAYGTALTAVSAAFSKESVERKRWADDLLRDPSVSTLLIGLALENIASLRSDVVKTGSPEDQKKLAKAVSELESMLAPASEPASAFLRTVRATNSALAGYAVATREHSAFLKGHDDELKRKYPDWQTWWVLLTCARHSDVHHLDFDTAIAN